MGWGNNTGNQSCKYHQVSRIQLVIWTVSGCNIANDIGCERVGADVLFTINEAITVTVNATCQICDQNDSVSTVDKAITITVHVLRTGS